MKISTSLFFLVVFIQATAYGMAPQVVTKTPSSGSSLVLTNEQFVVAFDANIAIGANAQATFRDLDNAIDRVYDASNITMALQVSGNLAIFNPAAVGGPLTPLTNYEITYNGGTFQDLGAVSNVTAMLSTEWTFMTGERSTRDKVMAGGHSHGYWLDGSSLNGAGRNDLGQLGFMGGGSSFPVNISGSYLSVASGQDFGLGIQTDGTLWSWGYNHDGQLGQNNNANAYFPTQIGFDSDWAVVAAGGRSAMAIKQDGTLFAWGENAHGQLGLGDQGDKIVPEEVAGGNVWREVAVGFNHTLAIKNDGSLWSWGENGFGQLGLGLPTNSLKLAPFQISAGPWRSVTAGAFHSFAIDETGQLHGWGRNHDGQLGVSNPALGTTPIAIEPGKLFGQVDAGVDHSLFLDLNGKVFGAGKNRFGQVGGNGLGLNPVEPGRTFRSIGTGAYQSYGMDTFGNLFVWGKNISGELGISGQKVVDQPMMQTLP
jgi:alpha-tubulin suppressor-like RCC1 family protein